MAANPVTGYCSWCFKKATHDLANRNYLRRNVYQCSKCQRGTVICRRPGCYALARSHDSWDDELCAVHDGIVSRWGGGRKAPTKLRWCSWCFEHTSHQLDEHNKLPGRRDVYHCTRCARRTLPCRRCNDAMARGQPTADDERCFQCAGAVEDWADKEANQKRARKNGWCSWCFDYAPHVLQERNIGPRRDVYYCDSCFNRTLPCRHCSRAFVRGGPGWDDENCELCSEGIRDWNKAKKRRNRIIDKEWSKAEMLQSLERRSDYKDKALEAGMIRPFLYLASMDPMMRNQVAAQLGWSLISTDYFGDPHAEAWAIINNSHQGIQARTNNAAETLSPLSHDCNWHETLYRTAKKCFKIVDRQELSYQKSIDLCRNSSDEVLPTFENWYLEKLAHLHAKNMTDAHVAELDALMNSKEVRELAKAMKSAGVATSVKSLQYAVSAMHNAIKAGGFNTYVLTVKVAAAMNKKLHTRIVMHQATKNVARIAAVLGPLGWVWMAVDFANLAFGSSHGRAFTAVQQILNQRLILGAETICIEDFY